MNTAIIQMILMDMAHHLLITHVSEIRAEYPHLSDSSVLWLMIKNAFEASSSECTDEIMKLSYDETAYLELELQRMAKRSIELHAEFTASGILSASA